MDAYGKRMDEGKSRMAGRPGFVSGRPTDVCAELPLQAGVTHPLPHPFREPAVETVWYASSMSHTDIALTAVFCAGQVITVAILAWRAHR